MAGGASVSSSLEKLGPTAARTTPCASSGSAPQPDSASAAETSSQRIQRERTHLESNTLHLESNTPDQCTSPPKGSLSFARRPTEGARVDEAEEPFQPVRSARDRAHPATAGRRRHR